MHRLGNGTTPAGGNDRTRQARGDIAQESTARITENHVFETQPHVITFQGQLDGPDDDSGEAIRNQVRLASHVLNVSGELRDVGKLPLLTSRPRLCHFRHGESERLVVNERRKLTAFQQEPEVANRQPEAKESTAERAVLAPPGG